MANETTTKPFYTDAPWIGKGTSVADLLTAEEAIKAANLDWTLEPVELFHNFNGERQVAQDYRGMRRSTDGEIISVLSNKYQPVQNKEAFQFFDSVVGTGAAKYDSAGAFRGGRKIWMMAKLKDVIKVKDDIVDQNLLLMNSHDGTVALKMFFTPIRVWCQNVLAAAAANSNRIETFYAKHTGNVSARMEIAKEIIGLSGAYFTEFGEKANTLAEHQLPASEFPKLLAKAFGIGDPATVTTIKDLGSDRKITEMEKIEDLFNGSGKGLSLPSIKGTRWAAYNAVVEYIDYGKQFRGKDPADNRLEYSWIKGTAVKDRAFKHLLAL